jgi:hypothetical protein
MLTLLLHAVASVKKVRTELDAIKLRIIDFYSSPGRCFLFEIFFPKTLLSQKIIKKFTSNAFHN